ncbi:GcrA family cell cycle regulator [Maritalea myrionectae]|uniref:GcrA family cell cycle regulator n=1 Tax=Maritalea myrionectae TaxID=454601 RepID=UPI0004231C32|nr:GcrA family cell cycle regulator [Maritalea myrionectae]
MNALFSKIGDWDQLSHESKISVVRMSRREGLSAKDLGELLNCSRSAICGFAYRNKIKMADAATSVAVAAAANKAHTIKRKRGRRSRDFDHKMAFRLDQSLRAKAKKKSVKAVFSPDHPANRNALLLTLVELEDHSCRWPIEVGSTTRYCGCTKADASKSYCAAHKALSNGTWVAPQDETPIGGTS